MSGKGSFPSELLKPQPKKMLAEKKPVEKKEEEKEPVHVIPPRPETPKLFKAALEMTEKSGLRGTLAKLKEQTKKSSLSLQPSICSSMLRTSPVPGHPSEQDPDPLSQSPISPSGIDDESRPGQKCLIYEGAALTERNMDGKDTTEE